MGIRGDRFSLPGAAIELLNLDEIDTADLGHAAQSLRSRNDWTLKEMSERTGIPASTLSKVERDRLTLTYDKLLQLSERLDISMSGLFAETEPERDVIVSARRSLGRIDRAIRVNTANYDYYYLCSELRRKRMIPVMIRILARNLAQFGELVRHAGEEYIYVIDGRVAIHTEFYDPIVLGSGESLYIDSNMAHGYLRADGCDDATVLAVCCSPDDSIVKTLMKLQEQPATPAAVR